MSHHHNNQNSLQKILMHRTCIQKGQLIIIRCTGKIQSELDLRHIAEKLPAMEVSRGEDNQGWYVLIR